MKNNENALMTVLVFLSYIYMNNLILLYTLFAII